MTSKEELPENELVSQSEELFARFTAIASRRRTATDACTAEIDDYLEDVRRDGQQITIEFLEGFFEKKWGKSDRVREWAQQTRQMLSNFDRAAALVMSSIATMSLHLKLAQETLAIEVMATPVRAMGKPITASSNSPLASAREELANIRAARKRLNENYVAALSNATELEMQAERSLWQATELLKGRRRRLLDFRKQHLSFSWRERLQRAKRESAKASKDEATELMWKAIEEVSEAMAEEAADVAQVRRAARWGAAVARIAGRKAQNRERNDTDNLIDLLDQLERENEEFRKLEETFATTASAIEAVRTNAENSFGGR
ncbi:hypothetical protein [Oceaniradius stylonematis]|uniref:hypothetical protein n=1 Tax=Oceaniradius stylonematis TaxID=2184161 RepID=UPI00273E2759|nr:hypothetical protein [Oceaniradius stylonematis]